jgi:hypothetical protein
MICFYGDYLVRVNPHETHPHLWVVTAETSDNPGWRCTLDNRVHTAVDAAAVMIGTLVNKGIST